MNLIDSIIKTPATRANVRLALPVLIHWAQTKQPNHTYTDLIAALGKKRFSGVGHVLGAEQDVMEALSKEMEIHIPTLNSLIKNEKTGLPAAGFSYVEPSYNSWTDDGKRIFVKGLDEEAMNFPHWSMVLSRLGLDPLITFTPDELSSIKTSSFGGIGEGAEHKALKEFIYNHPESLGLENVSSAQMEYTLPSGDRLDVYFELKDGCKVAVEVKSRISDDSDIIRGIFQCVKYEAVIKALSSVETGSTPKVIPILVTGRSLSDIHHKLVGKLNITHKLISK